MPTIEGVKVTQSQADVYNVLKQYGPLADHALVPIAQHQLGVRLSSSGIRSRRAELTGKGLLWFDGVVKTASGRDAASYKVR